MMFEVEWYAGVVTSWDSTRGNWGVQCEVVLRESFSLYAASLSHYEVPSSSHTSALPRNNHPRNASNINFETDLYF